MVTNHLLNGMILQVVVVFGSLMAAKKLVSRLSSDLGIDGTTVLDVSVLVASGPRGGGPAGPAPRPGGNMGGVLKFMGFKWF